MNSMSPFAISRIDSKPTIWARVATKPGLFVFLFCLLAGLAAVAWRAKAQGEFAHTQARNEAVARAALLELQFSRALTAAEVLGALSTQTGGTIPNFQKVATELLAARPGLNRLELQPGGVVSDIVPRAGNQRAIGFNVLQNEAQRPGALAAVQRRALTVAGPLPLDGGTPGIVVRVPIFLQGRDGRESFWGFVAASMSLPEALGRVRMAELPSKGYDYAFFAPGSPSTHGSAVTVAAHGASLFRDAVFQPVRAGNVEFRLALRPRAGWVSTTEVALECLGVVVLSSLACLLSNLSAGRWLAPGNAARGTWGSKDPGAPKDRTATPQVELGLAEAQAKMEQSVRNAYEANKTTQDKLRQAELKATELQARLDAAARTTAEAAQARQAELHQAQAALRQAQQTIAELEARLEAAEQKAAAMAQARSQQDQATIVGLQDRLSLALHSAKEAAAASAARLERLEQSNRELRVRAGETRELEARVKELTRLLAKAQAPLQPPPAETAGSSKAGSSAPTPSEPNESGRAETATPHAKPSARSNPAIVEAGAPASATAAKETPHLVSDESQAEPLTPPPAPAAVPRASTKPKTTLSVPPAAKDTPAGAAEPMPERPAQAKPVIPAKRRKPRQDAQIDLFEGPPERTKAEPVVDARPKVSTVEEPAPLGRGPAPSAAVSAEPEAVKPDVDPVKQVTSGSKTSGPIPTQPHSENAAAARGLPGAVAAAAADADLPTIDGLATVEGLARADGDLKRYLGALRQFVGEQAGTPDRIRETLLQGDLAAAGQTIQALKTTASVIGASTVEGAAAALARALQERTDPGEIESYWKTLERAVRDLVSDLRPLLKPKEGKAELASRPPAPRPVNSAQLRKAVNEILPLLVDEDPGAKDCLKANRAVFRSAFNPEDFAEFEQLAKKSALSPALELLKKAVKKHGISV